MVEDWLANAYDGMSRREFLAKVGVAGVGLAGFAIAATPVAGKVITTATEGLSAADGTVSSGGFAVPIYAVRPAAPGKYPAVLVIPEVFGMHEHIKDVTRRFARRDSWPSPSSPMPGKGACSTCPISMRFARSWTPSRCPGHGRPRCHRGLGQETPVRTGRPGRHDGILPRRDVHAPLCRHSRELKASVPGTASCGRP